jgi:NAD(P)-dependent dehydrogenase (short-subunit alcohol dehydrogenase family)
MSFEQLHSLIGHTVVITGANGAIARATAKRLRGLGANIIGIARTDTKEVRDFYASEEVEGILYFADVTDSAAIKQIVKEIPQCDVLINNAGWTKIVPHHDLNGLTDEDLDKMLGVNLKSVYTTTREFLPLLQKSNHAVIVNISSASANGAGYGSNVIYSATKSAINSLTKDWARALAPKVRVISISPPLVMDSDFSGWGREDKIKRGMRLPLKRGSNTEDIANTIEAYLTKIRFTTGVDVIVDGGRNLQ